MKATEHIVKRVGYGVLATAIVLGMSPATMALAAEAGNVSTTVLEQGVEQLSGSFVFSDDGVVASEGASGYKVSGTELTITAAGTYEVTGSCADGQICVKKGVSNVTIVLNGLTLAKDGDKAIKFKAGSTGNRIVVKGTNTLSTTNDKGIIKANAAEDDNGDLVLDSAGKTTGGDLTISGDGTLNLSSDYTAVVDGETEGCDAINCEGDLTVLGATFNIDVTDDAMHSDYVLTIGSEGAGGPTINVENATEGLEGATVNLYSGTGTINTTDDGINAANSDLASYNYQYGITIAGGTWKVVAAGDGIDSNGNLAISGGTTEVYCTGKANGALDIGEGSEGEIKGTFTYTGGTVFAVGSDMLVTPSTGTYVLFGGQGAMMGNAGASSASSIVTKGASVKVTSGSKALYTTTAAASGSYALFMADSLASGTSCTLSSGSSSTTATAGTGATAGANGMAGMQPGQMPGGQQPGTGNGQQPGTGNGQQPGTDNGQQWGQFPGQPPQGNDGNASGQQQGQQPGQMPQEQENQQAQDQQAQEDQQAQDQQAQNQQASTGDTSTNTDELERGDTVTAGSGATKATYTVVKTAGSGTGTVTYTKCKVSSTKTKAIVPASVKTNGKTYKVVGIASGAFKGTKVKTVTIKTKKLAKKRVKNALRGSKVKTVKVKVSSKAKTNKSYKTKYAKYFKRTNSGKKVAVK